MVWWKHNHLPVNSLVSHAPRSSASIQSRRSPPPRRRLDSRTISLCYPLLANVLTHDSIGPTCPFSRLHDLRRRNWAPARVAFPDTCPQADPFWSDENPVALGSRLFV